MVSGFVQWLMRRDLKRTFRRVAWAGSLPEEVVAPPDGRRHAPLVLYANHHGFYDGHLLHLLLDRALERPGTIWMEDWDRFPLFAAVGAQPFPRGTDRRAATRRRATIRRTVRHLRETPRTALVYFPEARLHPPHEGLLPFPENAFRRLGRLFPAETRWWPVALRVVQTGAARPTVLLTGGMPHGAPDGRERERLRGAWQRLAAAAPEDASRVLLDGTRGPDEQWDLSWTAPFFERYL